MPWSVQIKVNFKIQLKLFAVVVVVVEDFFNSWAISEKLYFKEYQYGFRNIHDY